MPRRQAANRMSFERMARIGWLTLAAAGAQGQAIVVGLEKMEVTPIPVLMQAEVTAERIYAGVGVELKWRSRGNAEIRVQFDTAEAPCDHARALGYAMPYAKEGTFIHVFFNRVSNAGSERQDGVLLGHVMAHELGHVLEGVRRHSDAGVMKAHWNYDDVAGMVFRPLSFSPLDAELVRAGVVRIAHSKVSTTIAAERR
jgi:hypothetical protein